MAGNSKTTTTAAHLMLLILALGAAALLLASETDASPIAASRQSHINSGGLDSDTVVAVKRVSEFLGKRRPSYWQEEDAALSEEDNNNNNRLKRISEFLG